MRHREEEIEKEIRLPKCHLKVTKIRMKGRAAVRYNQVVSQIRTNLITSRYEGFRFVLNFG